MRLNSALVGLSVALLTACEADIPLQPHDTGRLAELTPAEVFQRHAAMFEAVAAHHEAPALCVDGEWQLHYGDGCLYGPSYDLAQWKRTGRQDSLDRAVAALEANRIRLETAANDPIAALGDAEYIAMSLTSLIRSHLYLDNPGFKDEIDAIVDPIDEVGLTLGDYLDVQAGDFAAATYGPTSMTALFALNHSEYVRAFPDHRPAHHRARIESILAAARERVWDAERSIYRFAPEDERIMLYPNITMMLALAEATLATGDLSYVAHAQEVYEGIEPLRAASGDHFHSPYSAESMGALDEDYSTLSSQNYLILALFSMYLVTGEESLLIEIDIILTFIEDNLIEGGRILHHWMNGAKASPEDPYDYCLGCNMQTLYILLLLEETSQSDTLRERAKG